MAGRPYKESPGRWLVISDLQIPFEAEYALQFCKKVQREYRVPQANILNVGDEVDAYFGSQYRKNPDAIFTPTSELAITRDKVAEWGDAFPKMRLAISNHGTRWAKKAAEAEIPSQMLRAYRDIIGAPEGWQWRYRWEIDTKHPFTMLHGINYSGFGGARNAAIDNGRSTLIGHLHSHAGISYVRTHHLDIWGFNVGCLIDEEAFAFEYGKHMRHKPCLGVGVVLDEGKSAIWIPYNPKA